MASPAPCHFFKTLAVAILMSFSVLGGATWPTSATELEVFTSDNLPWIASDAIGLRYTGEIEGTLAGQISAALHGKERHFDHVVFELNSGGGELDAVREAVEVLRKARDSSELTTRVMSGAICGSGCIAIFMQGHKRKASGASIWIFHGATDSASNVPSLKATQQYLDLLASSGVGSRFLHHLVQEGYVTQPGAYIISGHELFQAGDANVITELLPAWEPESPRGLHLMTPR